MMLYGWMQNSRALHLPETRKMRKMGRLVKALSLYSDEYVVENCTNYRDNKSLNKVSLYKQINMFNNSKMF